jgi:hypothetical protein
VQEHDVSARAGLEDLMSKWSKGTVKEGNVLISVMRKSGVPAFNVDAFTLEDREAVYDMIDRAKRHCRLAEKYCSVAMDEEQLKRHNATEEGIEREIRRTAARLGLTAKFDGDPRGFTVKLHAPVEHHVYNTWGGLESGYGIGANE